MINLDKSVLTFCFQQDAAYIIWTGDLVPHDVWDTSKEENIIINDRLLSLMKQYFPTTPLYATLGNHEASPVNTSVALSLFSFFYCSKSNDSFFIFLKVLRLQKSLILNLLRNGCTMKPMHNGRNGCLLIPLPQFALVAITQPLFVLALELCR